MKLYPYLALFLFTTCGSLYAEPQKKDPIDIAMDKAKEQNPSTLGMVQAFTQADERWQKEIELLLAKLEAEMTPEQWKAVSASQKAWRAYRDKEFETQSAFYRAKKGTIWGPIAASKRMELNRDRALRLRDYLEPHSTR